LVQRLVSPSPGAAGESAVFQTLDKFLAG
jgi:hypothetical protein